MSNGIWAGRIRKWRQAGLTWDQVRVVVDSLGRDYNAGGGAGAYGSRTREQYVRNLIDRLEDSEDEAIEATNRRIMGGV